MDGWFACPNAFLRGRMTCEIFATRWPKVADESEIVARRSTTCYPTGIGASSTNCQCFARAASTSTFGNSGEAR